MQKAEGAGMCHLTLEREVPLETHIGSQHEDGIKSHEAAKIRPSSEGLQVWERGHDSPAEEPGKRCPRNQKEALSAVSPQLRMPGRRQAPSSAGLAGP